MNFGSGSDHSVVLISVRPNAPYRDRLEDEGTTLIFEGYDELRSDAVPVRQPSISLIVLPAALLYRTVGFTKPVQTSVASIR